MENTITKKQILIFISCLGCIFIGIVIFALIQFISRNGKIAVTIKYAPYSAEVTLDNEKLKNNAINYIKPGKYQLKISRQDFTTQEETVTIDETTEYLYGLLAPANERGEQISKDRAQDFYEVQGIAGMLANQYGTEERKEYPILKQLPFKNSLYNLGYTYDDQNSPIITIGTYSLTSINPAIIKLQSLAASVEDSLIRYDIQINNFTNLLQDKIQPLDISNPLEFLKSNLQNTEYQVQTGEQIDDYYYTNILTGSERDYTIVTYKIILVRNGTSWRLVGTPYPILTQHNTPNVPDSILKSANNFNN